MQYRPEIDGLRAIAILPVLFFHAGIGFFDGGYAGVDVFFVISGYLITALIQIDNENNKFSLWQFYERRARRILPALFVMLFVCFWLAWFWMLPSSFSRFLNTFISSIFFMANYVLYKNAGDYFWTVADETPLLHMWSISVEEHFYLLFPLFLVWAKRFPTQVIFKCLILFICISVVVVEFFVVIKPTASFYFSFFRFWELVAGSTAAFLLHGNLGINVSRCQYKSLIGFVMVLGSFLLLDHSAGFPGLWAVFPVLGTWLVIVYTKGCDGIVSKILRCRMLVLIGLISYSLYLWHQPILSFVKILFFGSISEAWVLCILVFVFFVAALSWKFVETPFRKSLPSKFFWSFLVCMLALNLGVWWLGTKFVDSDFRLPSAVVELVEGGREDFSERSSCLLQNGSQLPGAIVDGCLVGDLLGDTVFMIGDSHLEALRPALQGQLASKGIGSYSLAYAGCLALPNFERLGLSDQHRCSDYVESMISLAAKSNAKTLLLVGRFPLYLEGTYYDNQEGGVEFRGTAAVDVVDAVYDRWIELDRRNRVANQIERELLKLARKFNVIIVEPVPEVGWHVTKKKARRLLYGLQDTPITHSLAVREERVSGWSDLIGRVMVSTPRVHYLPISDLFCSEKTGRCQTEGEDGSLWYIDGDHLSFAGAQRVSRHLLSDIASIHMRSNHSHRRIVFRTATKQIVHRML